MKTFMFFLMVLFVAVAQPAKGATKLYSTNFSPAQTTLSPIIIGGTDGGRQAITGINAATGQSESIVPFGAEASYIDISTYSSTQVDATTVRNYQTNDIVQTAGPFGPSVYALFQDIINIPADCCAQNNLMIYRPGQSTDPDMYYTIWFKFGAGMDMGSSYRVMSEIKAGGSTDYRTDTWVSQDANGLYWTTEGDGWDNNGTHYNYWTVQNHTVPVPVGQWFKYEVFFHRASNSTGRYWAAVNGQVIVDYHGSLYPNPSNIPQPWETIDRIFLNNDYSDGGNATPWEQWTTNLEIWDGFPCGVGVSCYNSSPNVSLSANPSTISAGQSSTLTWSSSNTTACSASWTTSTATSGSKVVSPTTTTPYSITCMGITSTATVTIGVGGTTLSTSATSLAPGAALTATVTNGPGTPNDWVGFYPATTALDYPVAWKAMNDTQTQSTTGITNATLHFNAVDTSGNPAVPGQYNFRLYNGDTYALVANSPTITVTNASTRVSVYDPSLVAATISNVVWETKTKRQYKSWVEGFSTTANFSTLTHDIAYLTPYKLYKIKTDGLYKGVKGVADTLCATSSCKANAKGFIHFKTTLPYASLTHKFEIEVT